MPHLQTQHQKFDTRRVAYTSTSLHIRRGAGAAGILRAHASRNVSCSCLAPDINQAHILPNIVTSVYESNITAAQCYAAYGRTPNSVGIGMLSAPPLTGAHGGARVGPAGEHHGNHLLTTANRSEASGAASGWRELGTGFSVAPLHGLLADDIKEPDFGLAACLATPMDPGPGVLRRLVHVPATTTAARSAAAKLAAGDDVLTEASCAGEWVRRQRRQRRRLAAAQAALGSQDSTAARGRRQASEAEGGDEAEGQLSCAQLGHRTAGLSQAAGQAAGDRHERTAAASASRHRGGEGEEAVVADPAAAVAAASTLLEAWQQDSERLQAEAGGAAGGRGAKHGLAYTSLDEGGYSYDEELPLELEVLVA